MEGEKTIIVLVTTLKGKGKEIARYILEKRLAACVNIANIKSLYWWEGKIEEDEEDLLLIKTKEELYEELEKEIRKIHPYKIPEILAIKIEKGLREYLDWVKLETKTQQ